MQHTDADVARAWLVDGGVRQTGPDTWAYDDEPERPLTKNDVALECSSWIYEDDDLDEPGKIRVALGMVDILDELWTAEELHFPYCLRGKVPPPELWAGLRERLEAPTLSTVIDNSIWHSWFECRATSEGAFRALIGDELADRDALAAAAAPDLFLRRAARVLDLSGPVAWEVKERAYRCASEIDGLHQAVFKAILASYHDYFGNLEPAPPSISSTG
ncbi:hypothetical protein ACIGB8_02720 [Promicromonospora sukumoe]|uniref:hypothetical protein n=1 Tax=Promicromonospora sukumoe TaxID=88382 RepID=UPI0037C7C00A